MNPDQELGHQLLTEQPVAAPANSKKKFILIGVASACAVALIVALSVTLTHHSNSDYHAEFKQFEDTYQKSYANEAERGRRYQIFAANMKMINEHNNSGKHKHTLRMNKFGDMTTEEFQNTYLRKNYQRTIRGNRSNKVSVQAADVPDSIDWVAQGAVTDVKNQGQCGSCWSFSTTGAMEGINAITNGQLVSLSEQMLVDCSGSYGNNGCSGGLPSSAFSYVQNNGGLCSESDYPYQGVQGDCQSSSCTVVSGTALTGYQSVDQDDEDSLQAAVAQQPVSVIVDASQWQFYSGGVLATSDCTTNLDHAVLAVGYDTYSDGTPYWNIKNSWGTDWGNSGYIYLQRGSGSGNPGTCGVAMEPTYPTLN